MKRLLILIPVLIGMGCGSKATAPVSQGDESAPNEDDSWFCQVGATDEEWDCVQSETLAAAHTPTRIAASRAAAPAAPLPAQLPGPPPTAPVEIAPPPPAPVPAPVSVPTSAPTVAEESTPPINSTSNRKPQSQNEPKHIQLSYRPEKPVAILDLPKEFWAVQLVALSSKEALEAFAKKHNVRGMSAARVWNGQELFYVLLLGIYETRDRASEAIASLTPPFDTYSPWVRSVGSLQNAMVDADRHTGSSKI